MKQRLRPNVPLRFRQVPCGNRVDKADILVPHSDLPLASQNSSALSRKRVWWPNHETHAIVRARCIIPTTENRGPITCPPSFARLEGRSWKSCGPNGSEMPADMKAGSKTGPRIRSKATSSKAGPKRSRTWVVFQPIRPVQGLILWMKDQMS